MFGHHKAAREEKKLMKSKQDLNRQKNKFSKGTQDREKKAAEMQQSQVAEKTAKAAEERKNAYGVGNQRIRDLFNDPTIMGLDKTQRQALQYEANKGIQRSHQSANRKLLGDQATHGIQGRGGVGYAQQRDLQRMAQEAQGGVHRDLDKLNSDLRMKNIAAIFAGEQGEAAQSQLDKQTAIDELQLADEKKRQRMFEDRFYQQFSRV